MVAFAYCNTTLYDQTTDGEVPIFGNITFYNFGLALCGSFGLFALVTSLFLMFMHATHYSRPWEQRHILRILFMIPIYSIVSFLSYWHYRHAIYYQVLRDCYEAFAIASFFALMCHYVSPTLKGQKEYFREVTPKPWLPPVAWFRMCCGGDRGIWRVPRSGLTWFNIVWFCIFQYCFTRVACTIIAVSTQAAGKYCLESLSPAFAHVWVTVIESVAVTFAMFCIIQMYYQIKEQIAEHKPVLKLLSIKLVIFLIFWQGILLSILSSTSVHAIRAGPHLKYPDINVGLIALLVNLEMAIFAILHIFAYPWRAYDLKKNPNLNADVEIWKGASALKYNDLNRYHGGFLGLRAFGQAFNPWDIIKAVGRGFKWMFVGRKTRHLDKSYNLDAVKDASSAFVPTSAQGKNGKYQALDEDDDSLPLAPAPYQDYMKDGKPTVDAYSVDDANSDIGMAKHRFTNLDRKEDSTLLPKLFGRKERRSSRQHGDIPQPQLQTQQNTQQSEPSGIRDPPYLYRGPASPNTQIQQHVQQYQAQYQNYRPPAPPPPPQLNSRPLSFSTSPAQPQFDTQTQTQYAPHTVLPSQSVPAWDKTLPPTPTTKQQMYYQQNPGVITGMRAPGQQGQGQGTSYDAYRPS